MILSAAQQSHALCTINARYPHIFLLSQFFFFNPAGVELFFKFRFLPVSRAVIRLYPALRDYFTLLLFILEAKVFQKIQSKRLTNVVNNINLLFYTI